MSFLIRDTVTGANYVHITDSLKKSTQLLNTNFKKPRDSTKIKTRS